MGRLRKAFGRYRASGNLTVVVVGGSISAGAGAVDSHSWVEYLEDWMHLHFNASRDLTRKDDKPGAVHVLNSAVPGTFSSYMSVCYNVHVPQTADIIVVEYALNDEQTLSNVLFDNSVRRPFERLLRHLLSYPNQPAVILLNAYSWFQMEDSKPDGLYYTGSDGEFHELATYYQVNYPIQHGTRCWVRGFNVSRTRARDDGGREDPALDQQLRGDVFYFDVVHPDGNTGHRAMADLVIQLFADATKGPSRRRPAHAAHNALPPPMIPGNWESRSDKCFIGGALQEIAVPDASPSPGVCHVPSILPIQVQAIVNEQPPCPSLGPPFEPNQ
ncbi:hypothetical protein QJQ45_008221 [Haematococcus lacustris]|nr:hypothetical protein QJQ45_008221 [Haematococcus lacustris]